MHHNFQQQKCTTTAPEKQILKCCFKLYQNKHALYSKFNYADVNSADLLKNRAFTTKFLHLTLISANSNFQKHFPSTKIRNKFRRTCTLQKFKVSGSYKFGHLLSFFSYCTTISKFHTELQFQTRSPGIQSKPMQHNMQNTRTASKFANH